MYSLFIVRGAPFFNRLNLFRICFNHSLPYNESQVGYFFFFEEALGFLEVEVVLSKPLQYLMY